MTTHDRLLAGRYELINEIGHDDLTVAYRALDTHEKSNLGEARTVLVKVVRAQYNESPHVLQRFLELAAADEELRGPHVADVYHSGEDSGVYYLVAEWVDGPSLRRV